MTGETITIMDGLPNFLIDRKIAGDEPMMAGNLDFVVMRNAHRNDRF
jgi:hypothetical protein